MIDYTNQVIYMNGKLYQVESCFEGNEDLSWHGSPWYETFVRAKELSTGEVFIFGNQSYEWVDALNYIKSLEEKVQKIKDII